MKTHQIANLLEKLASALRRGPNIELSEASVIDTLQREDVSTPQMEVGIDMLLSLSKIDKNEWKTFLREYGFPIQIVPRDSSRNIIDKLLRFLKEHPEAHKIIRQSASRQGGSTADAISKALSALLKDES